ncbi:MAG: hypothetical protein ACI857_002417 [Arenicella sp.]|jgi:hypothetical protein
MRKIIANYNLISNIDELLTKENTPMPELSLTANIAQGCSIGNLFTKADFREFIVRLCLRYGLINPQKTYFEKDHIISAEIKESNELINLDPKKLIRFIGLIAIEGRLYSASREGFLNRLATEQRSLIWMEVFSPYKIHHWEDKKNTKDQVVISIKENTPDISKESISNAEAFADFIVKDFDSEIFKSFQKKNRAYIKVLEGKEWEIGRIKFNIEMIPMDFLKNFIITQRGEEYFNEELFEVYDTDEYDIEFSLIKLVWVIANGYTKYEYYKGQPVDLIVDPKVDFDYDKYQGLMHDEIGGINILQTYLDYNLEPAVEYLINLQIN